MNCIQHNVIEKARQDCKQAGYRNCQHEHLQAQFLICDRCHKVEEVGISPPLLRQLAGSVADSGFVIKNLQLELHGVCQACQAD